MRPKRIVWFSRHPILPSQDTELRRLFGQDAEILQDPNPFSSAEEIVRRFRATGGDKMVAVAPLSVLGRLCDLGIRPLWPDMEQVLLKNAEVVAAGRDYRFVRFRQVKRLALEFEDA